MWSLSDAAHDAGRWLAGSPAAAFVQSPVIATVAVVLILAILARFFFRPSATALIRFTLVAGLATFGMLAAHYYLFENSSKASWYFGSGRDTALRAHAAPLAFTVADGYLPVGPEARDPVDGGGFRSRPARAATRRGPDAAAFTAAFLPDAASAAPASSAASAASAASSAAASTLSPAPVSYPSAPDTLNFAAL